MQTNTSNPKIPQTTPTPLEKLTKTLNKTYRITITDGRIFQGKFICVDKACNIILADSEEFQPTPKNPTEIQEKVKLNREMYWPRSERYDGGRGGRELGMIMLPKKVILKIEADVGEDWDGPKI